MFIDMKSGKGRSLITGPLFWEKETKKIEREKETEEWKAQRKYLYMRQWNIGIHEYKLSMRPPASYSSAEP